MTKKILLFVLLILCLPAYNVFATSSSTIVMENQSGRILYSYNADSKSLIASTTKIMTCIIVLENMDLDKKITAGEEILKMYGTNIYIEVGEELSVKDLLYGLMLRSGNDAAITLAINTFGSEEEFVSQMNKKAVEIGMKNTNFENVHGLDDETKNYSIASDMALLARYAYKNKMYRKIISTKKYSCKSSLKSYLWYNRVSILSNYKYSLGGKNGYTPSAGKTLVSYARKNGMTLIIVSLNDSDIYNNHEYLFEDYFSKYKLYKIIDKNNFIYNKKLIGKDIYLKKSFSYPLTEEEVEDVSTLLNIKSEDNRNICGNISIRLNNKEIGKINVYVKKKNKKKDVSIFQKFINLFKN